MDKKVKTIQVKNSGTNKMRYVDVVNKLGRI